MSAPLSPSLRLRAVVLALAGGVEITACKPDLAVRESLVTEVRILAVRGEAAEALPGESVTYSVLVASPEGALSNPVTSWAYCATPKLLTENGAVSRACLGADVRSIASGPSTVTAAVPADACALFGPEVSAADLRPRDPDATGGYYQPLRVSVLGAEMTAYGLERIRCNLAGANAETVAEYAQRYVPNRNPSPPMLEARVGERTVPLDDLPRSTTVTLRASWPASDAERYVVFDLAAQRLVERREAMRVSWFATAGTFASDRTGRTEDELDAYTDDEWATPATAQTTHVFTVLRDDRGGVAFATYALVTR